MPNFDDLKLSIEALSGGKNTVLFDDLGMPSVMVPFPKLKMSDLIAGGSENIHPAFSVDGVEKSVIYVSKYQNIVLNERGYSLPMRDPRASLNFDQAVAYCRNKGKDGALHLIPCGLLLLYGVVKTGPCREAITITEPITHMDMKKVFRLITRVGKLPDAQPDPDRIHGTITGCLMELQT